MSLDDDLSADRCYRCEGTTGYRADVRLAGIGRFRWNNDPTELDVNAMVVTSVANLRCLDCGALVRQRRAARSIAAALDKVYGRG